MRHYCSAVQQCVYDPMPAAVGLPLNSGEEGGRPPLLRVLMSGRGLLACALVVQSASVFPPAFSGLAVVIIDRLLSWVWADVGLLCAALCAQSFCCPLLRDMAHPVQHCQWPATRR